MAQHRIHIETVFAEDLLELPEGVFIRGAKVLDGSLVLIVESADDLGSVDLDAVYGSYEDEDRVHLGALEPRAS